MGDDTLDRERCVSFPAQGNCLLGADNREDWNCEVCRAIEWWKESGRSVVLLREILHQHGLYALPGDFQQVPESERGCYLMQLRFQDMSSADIRLAFQQILASAEQAWLACDNSSVRVK
jgi:hypothetical protein